MKKRVTKKNLTRAGLVEALGCSESTVDRLIRRGLKASGRQGRANVYSLQKAQLLLERSSADPTTRAALLEDYSATAADLRDRARALDEVWIADALWTPAWASCVRWYEAQTASWPSSIARVLAPLTAAAAARADQGELPPGPAWRVLPAAELLRESWPWMQRARPRLQEIARSGGLVQVREDGVGWAPCGLWLEDPAPIHRAFPLVDPLLAGLGDAMDAAEPWAALRAVLEAPAAEASLARPRDVDEARTRWRTARAEFRRARVAVRRGHHRRADVDRAIRAAIGSTRLAWQRLRDQAPGLAGDHLRAATAAEGTRRETIVTLTTLGGLLPAEQPKEDG
jgi:hypothetical protein